jgi:hypothetical protein
LTEVPSHQCAAASLRILPIHPVTRPVHQLDDHAPGLTGRIGRQIDHQQVIGRIPTQSPGGAASTICVGEGGTTGSAGRARTGEAPITARPEATEKKAERRPDRERINILPL